MVQPALGVRCRRALTALLIGGSAVALGGGASLAVAATSAEQGQIRHRAASSARVDGWGAYVGNDLPNGGAPAARRAHHHHRHHRSVGQRSAAPAPAARFSPHPIAGIPGSVVQLATANSTSFALTSTGAVYAAGDGLAGQLGNGTREKRSVRFVRVHIPSGVKIASLANPSPYDAGMALATDGRVYAWGNDANQEFCEPSERNYDTPVEVSLANVTMVVGAQRHALYDAGGRIVSCGLGTYGQLGNGTSGASSQTGTPVAVRGLPSGTVTALTSGYGNAGVVMAGGAYYDWGLNNHGQVGDGSRTDATTARRVSLPAGVRQASEGGSIATNGQAMALLSNGQLWEWGANGAGQMGDGTTSDQLSPRRLIEPAGVTFTKVDSGGATDYAITGSGQLWDWGANSEGELGTGSHVTHVTHPVETGLTVRQVSSTATNVEALLSLGS